MSATAGVHLASVYSPNSYGGADPAFAPFTQFDSSGKAIGGFGPESVMTSRSHSTYHALQSSLSKNSARAGLGLQASYTYSKSLDDTSSVLGGLIAGAGVVLQTLPQNPWNPGAEKGPSTFDATHSFTLESDPGAAARSRQLSAAAGKNAHPGLAIPEYHHADQRLAVHGLFRSAANRCGSGRNRPSRPGGAAAFFHQRRGARGLFRAGRRQRVILFDSDQRCPAAPAPTTAASAPWDATPSAGRAFKDFDVALIKDTPFGRRGNAEFGTVEFRAEFFNVFNLVNFGLPSNILRGSGFGIISKTAGPSRQIQFSLKLIY